MNNIVIARYKEDVSWISLIDPKLYNFYIYDKGNNNDVIIDGYNINNIQLYNVGREAHTFLTYIIQNYNNLPDYSIFLQGEPFEHLTNNIREILSITSLRNDYKFYLDIINNVDYKELNLIEILNSNILSDMPLGDAFHMENINGTNVSSSLNLNLFWNLLFDDVVSEFQFCCGAQYIVSKQNILKRNIEFYEKCLKLINIYSQFPWILERLWEVIYYSNIKNK